MFHFFHYGDLKLRVVNVLLLFEKFMLLEHFDSVIFIRGRNFTQKDFTESSFSDNCKKLKIINFKLKLSELGWIRNLSDNKHVERAVSGDDFIFVSS